MNDVAPRARTGDIVRMDACALSDAIRARRLSCVEAMSAYLDQIERFNPAVNAIVSLRERHSGGLAHPWARSNGRSRRGPPGSCGLLGGSLPFRTSSAERAWPAAQSARRMSQSPNELDPNNVPLPDARYCNFLRTERQRRQTRRRRA